MIFRSPYPSVAIPDASFSAYVFANLARWADRIAFIDGATGRTLTHRQVYDGARRVAASLARRGLRKGDVVAIVSPNDPDYAIAFHGVALAGGVVTTVNPLNTTHEIAVQLRDADARFAIVATACLRNVQDAATEAGTRMREIFVLGEAAGATPFTELLHDAGDPPAVSIDPAADLLALPYSSGTTGVAKGVMITHRNAVAMFALSEPLAPDLTGHITLALLPFFHCYGMHVLMNGALRRGTTCVTMRRFDLEQFLQLIERHRVTMLTLVPPLVLALAKHPLVAKYDLSSVQMVGCGAAPLDAETQQSAAARLHAEVRQGYGLTEAVVGVTGVPLQGARIKSGSVGPLLPNIEARVVDVTTGEDLGTGVRGELWVRGPNVMRGYLKQPEASAATIDVDGWLHTGDIGMFDEDGHLFIVDRLKELIKYKGFQVAPALLEGILQQHPQVADAAVIGIPDPEAGEVPKAFVVARGAADAEAIMGFVAERVAHYERLHALEFIEAIPKSPSGKILRRLLRERPH